MQDVVHMFKILGAIYLGCVLYGHSFGTEKILDIEMKWHEWH